MGGPPSKRSQFPVQSAGRYCMSTVGRSGVLVRMLGSTGILRTVATAGNVSLWFRSTLVCASAPRLISFNTSMTFDGIISGGSECGLSRVLCAECGGTFRSSSTLEYTRSVATKLRCDNDGTERQGGRYKGDRRLVTGCQYPIKVVVVVITSKGSSNSDLGSA